MYDINWSSKAKKQLRKIEISHRQGILNAVEMLGDFQRLSNVKKLVNHKYHYRLRVGRYRILFDVTREVRIISVQEIRKRDEQTY